MNRPPSQGGRRLSPAAQARRRAEIKRRREKERATVRLLAFFNLLVLVILIVLLATGGSKTPTPTPPAGESDAASDSVQQGSGESESTPSDAPVNGTMGAPESDPSATEPPMPTVTFKAALSAYEEYMNPQGEQRDAYLLLVNPTHPLTEAYHPTDLTDVSATRDDGRNMQKLRYDAAMALEALFLEADALGYLNDRTGYELSVTSAYRTYAYQEYLFNNYVSQEMDADPSLTRAEAEAIVEQYSCRPGTSEHQSGLCADLHNQSHASSSHPENFANTPEGQWMTENCWKFGFVLRFPADKTEVTGIKYESWHFRYVGRYHAYRMTQGNLCLEEYVALLGEN